MTSFDLWFPTFADLRYWWVNQASERSSQEENVGWDTRWDSWISHLQNNCSKAKSAVWSHRGRREWVIFQLFCYWSPLQLFLFSHLINAPSQEAWGGVCMMIKTKMAACADYCFSFTHPFPWFNQGNRFLLGCILMQDKGQCSQFNRP